MSSIEYLLEAADKEMLVEMVRFTQKQRLRGMKGGWKEFLECHDQKFGSSLSDPSRRSEDILSAFLRTFIEEKDLKIFSKVLRLRSSCKAVEEHFLESPEQKLVLQTIQHPRFMQCFLQPGCEEFMVTKFGKCSKSMKSSKMIAIDCEMVLCEDGTDAVVKICAVDDKLEVVIDKLVNPNKTIVDFRTEITGISAEDLEGVTCTLADIQKSLKKLLKGGTILVGHALYNDLKALNVDHARVIETQLIFKFQGDKTRSRISLNDLCKVVLGCAVREEGAPHNCLDDARAAMKLVLAKLGNGFDDPLPIETRHVPAADPTKLLLHKVPINVSCEELSKLFPEYPSAVIERERRVRFKTYSVAVIFKDPKDAWEAFDKIEGVEEKDIVGMPQKLTSLQLSTGATTTLYVRKMASENVLPEKRPFQDEIANYKKLRACSSECDHVKEIERLKQELKQKDDELLNLQKIVSALTRKHGL